MTLRRLLVANRGEIAVRILRTAGDMGIATVAVHSADDAPGLHVRQADQAVALPGVGVLPYLDIDGLVRAAVETDCDALHPGYGFLAERAQLAAACDAAGIAFVGPTPAQLDLFGDKLRARAAAAAAGVPVVPGTMGPTSLAEAETFLASQDGHPVIIKAVAGGGGRGMRIVEVPGALAAEFARCESEAEKAFGNGTLYLERLLPAVRHIEVQIVGDGRGNVVHLWERDCSMQRRHQKLIEIAPAPNLHPDVRDRLTEAAVRMASAASYRNLGTFEFLVGMGSNDSAAGIAFIEANPRLQVEHTVTEAITSLDLVELQLQIAAGASLTDLGLTQAAVPMPRGFAIQHRVNTERMTTEGALPTGGLLQTFEPPSGPGIRTDTHGYGGYSTSPHFDSLLAKLIVYREGPFDGVLKRAYRALCEFRIEGVETNLGLLQDLIRHPVLSAAPVHTRFVDEVLPALLAAPASHQRRHYVPDAADQAAGRAGASVDRDDPLSVLAYGQAAARSRGVATAAPPAGVQSVGAPLQGTVIALEVAAGAEVHAGQLLLVMGAMKMEHEVRAPVSGRIRTLGVVVGDTVFAGHSLLEIEEADVAAAAAVSDAALDPDLIRPDLAEVVARRATTRDDARPAAVERRRRKSQRTARENVEDLCDPGTFVEYGGLVLAAQRRRRSLEELIEKSPADGMITGVGRINGAQFDDPEARCAVMAYDYTVFAGTQGGQNHRKTDRLIDIAEAGRMPMVLFAEGGGGRPGDTDSMGDGQRTFARFPTLSGLVPMVGIVAGRCFAGNASLAGCCDVLIATRDANLGMGGPAMIEGGGLGVFAPEDIGAMDVQIPNGVVDVAVADEAEAVAVARQYLGFFQGRVREWDAPDQRPLRHVVPENRLRVYDIRTVIDTLADAQSVLELRRGFGEGMVTALARVEGRPVGIIANNPVHLGGAIDADGADKAARFMQLCDAFDVPLIYLCDTPGIMVGPEVEKTALVRHSSRMFLIGCNLSVPFFTVVLRKAYGLGGIAMAGGSYKFPVATVAWPTGEFGGMGLEGQVKLGYRNELAAITDPVERRERFETMVAAAYEHGKALNQASLFHVDDTIDPADTRWWLANLLSSLRPPAPRTGKKRPSLDAW